KPARSRRPALIAVAVAGVVALALALAFGRERDRPATDPDATTPRRQEPVVTTAPRSTAAVKPPGVVLAYRKGAKRPRDARAHPPRLRRVKTEWEKAPMPGHVMVKFIDDEHLAVLGLEVGAQSVRILDVNDDAASPEPAWTWRITGDFRAWALRTLSAD